MKKVLLSVGLLFAAYCMQAHGLERVIVEKYYISTEADSIASADNGGGVLPVGSVTYRVFLDLKPDYSFQAIMAVDNSSVGGNPHPIHVKTTTAFYNNETRGATTPNAIPKSELKKQTIMLDSWFSAGAASKDYFGVLKSEDTTSVEIVNINGALQNDDVRFGVPVKTRDGLMASPKVALVTPAFTASMDEQLAIFGDTNPEQRNGQEFSVTDGAIFCAAVAQGPTSENKILIGQFTTDGVFSFELNVQIRNEKMDDKYFAKVNQLVARNPLSLADSSVVQYLYPGLIYPMEGMPNVTVALPKGNSYKTGDAVTINATTTGNNIASVEFFVDNVSLGAADTQAPYTTNYSATTGKHTIVAKVTNDIGEEFSAPVLITATATDVEATDVEKTVAYPNPVSDELTIEVGNSAIGSNYELRNVVGTAVLVGTLTTTKQIVTMAHLPEGCYTLVVKNEQGVTCKNIVKQ